MEPSDARHTLLELDRLRHGTRRALHPLWFSNLVVGIFFLGATLVAAAADSAAPALAYWIIGGVAGMGAIVAHAVRHERELGAEAPVFDVSVVLVVLTVGGAIAINALTESQVGWAFAVCGGWFAIAALYRDAPMAAAGAALAAVAAAMLAADPAHAGLWTQGAMAVLLVAAGLAGRLRG